MCWRTRTRVVREGAHDRSFIGEGNGKVGRNVRESGGGVKVRGDEGRKGNQWKIGRWSRGCRKEKPELEKPSRSAKRGVRREKWEIFPEKSSAVGRKTRKDEKKWTSRGKKRVRFLEKSPENGLRTGKSGKNGDYGAKKEGWGRDEKMGFTPDFAMP